MLALAATAVVLLPAIAVAVGKLMKAQATPAVSTEAVAVTPVDAVPELIQAGPPCVLRTNCEHGFNCIAHHCVAADGDCRAIKDMYPASPSGVYWLKVNPDASRLAYCEMTNAVDLCNEEGGAHYGETLDGAKMPFALTSVLDAPAGECTIWAVRNAKDNLPFSARMASENELDTCQALGFLRDVAVGTCLYGSKRSTCGFAVNPLKYEWYGNYCQGCPGDSQKLHSGYVKQGPIEVGPAISSMDGSVTTTCRVE